MKKRDWTTVLLALIFVVGLVLLLYPSVSDYYNSFHQTRAIAHYAESVGGMSREEDERMLAEAEAYNHALLSRGSAYALEEDRQEVYEGLLDVTGTGIMGYIDIPSIACTLPIYHGTNESVLQIAVGHIEWSSLPVGGESTHCVLSGHRGLPSAKLFTNLDQLIEGDEFTLQILDQVLTYEVDQILIVEPADVAALGIVEGMDYCTLVTCTPYGINTHRMLVRGHRVETQRVSNARVVADALQVEPVIVAPIMAAPLLLILMAGALALPDLRRKKGL